MPVNLKRLEKNKTEISLSMNNAYYGKGHIEHEEIRKGDKIEPRYYYVSNGQRIRISRYGPNRIVMQDGGLVKLVKG